MRSPRHPRLASIATAASLVVLVGSVARSQRFRTQLLDAVSSLHVGYPAYLDPIQSAQR